MSIYGRHEYLMGIIFKHLKYCTFSHSRTPEDLRTPENVRNHMCYKKYREKDFIDSCVFSTRQ